MAFALFPRVAAADDCPSTVPHTKGAPPTGATITVHPGITTDCIVHLPGGAILRASGAVAPYERGVYSGRAVFRVSGVGLDGPGEITIVTSASTDASPTAPELVARFPAAAVVTLPTRTILVRLDPATGEFVPVPDGHIYLADDTVYKIIRRGGSALPRPLSQAPPPTPPLNSAPTGISPSVTTTDGEWSDLVPMAALDSMLLTLGYALLRLIDRHRRSCRPSVRRRVVLSVVLALGLDIVCCAGSAAIGGYEVLALQHKVQHIAPGTLGSTIADLRGRLTLASDAFRLAHLSWLPWQPLATTVATIGPARAVGTIGPLLDVVAAGSASGVQVLDGLATSGAALGQANRSGADRISLLLDDVQHHRSAFQAALDDLGQAENAWSALDLHALPAPLATRARSISHLLLSGDEAVRVALAAPEILGATQPRTYLLAPENTWDLRATGGFIGTSALLVVRQGHLQLTAQQPSTSVDDITSRRGRAYIPPPLPLLAYQHFSNWFYRDANWSPDFPTSAATLRYFYWLGQGRLPDGVIAFDTNVLGSLLRITGPVHVPGTTVTLNAATGVQTLDRYVNKEDGSHDKRFASQAYGAVFRQLQALPLAKLPLAVRVLGTALQERHILLWIPNPALEPILAHHGWDGAINPTRADYLYVVDTNVHGNKINKLVREHVFYNAVVQSDRSLRSTATITFDNTADQHNLPPAQNNTLYDDVVRLYVPLGSRLLGTSGLTQWWNTTCAHNKTVFTGYVRVPSRTRRSISFTYRVPPNALMDASTYMLTLQKQPGRDAVSLDVTLHAGARAVQLNGYSMWAWRGSLDTDLTLAVPLRGGHAVPDVVAYNATTDVAVKPGSEIEPTVILPRTLPTPPISCHTC